MILGAQFLSAAGFIINYFAHNLTCLVVFNQYMLTFSLSFLICKTD